MGLYIAERRGQWRENVPTGDIILEGIAVKRASLIQSPDGQIEKYNTTPSGTAKSMIS